MTDQELAESLGRLNARLEEYVTSLVAAEMLYETGSFFKKLEDLYFDVDAEKSVKYWRDQLVDLSMEYDTAISEAGRNEREIRPEAYTKEPDQIFEAAKEELNDWKNLNRSYLRFYAKKKD